jgi:predicted TIM-barrel fold metal-dependent hydrolase
MKDGFRVFDTHTHMGTARHSSRAATSGERVPADRLMAGSDLPENTSTEMGKFFTLDISEADRRSILYGKACCDFGGS